MKISKALQERIDVIKAQAETSYKIYINNKNSDDPARCKMAERNKVEWYTAINMIDLLTDDDYFKKIRDIYMVENEELNDLDA